LKEQIMTVRPILVNSAVLLISCVIGLVLCEVGVRFALTASDYLTVEMVSDEVLGAVPSRHTRAGGYDSWGFRNRHVPDSSDVVAIGDSHTYGNTARMDDAWPAVLERLSGRSVYNMGLGGYGPNQYFHLLQTKAIKLKPQTIVVGLYMGDDFENAFLITYGLDHWAYLRTLPKEKVNFDIWEAPTAPTWQKKIRIWLSRHSVIYQLVFHGPLLGRFQGETQIKYAPQFSDRATALIIPEKNILEGFLPTGILRRLDQESESVREGMRITFKLLAEMNEISRQNNAQFVVAVIPTKEMVFAEYLEHNSQLPLSDVVDKVISNERSAREKTFEFLKHSQIAYVDTLPALRRSLSQELYASDPPPLKWSDLRYVFDIQEDCNGKEALQARRDRREAAPGRCSSLAGPGHDGGDPADRCERGDLLSLASRVWRAEDRAGQAPEGA